MGWTYNKMNDNPKYQSTTLTLVPRSKEGRSERKSTSLKVDPDVYTEFAIVARRRHMEISDLLDYAMNLVIQEQKDREHQESTRRRK